MTTAQALDTVLNMARKCRHAVDAMPRPNNKRQIFEIEAIEEVESLLKSYEDNDYKDEDYSD